MHLLCKTAIEKLDRLLLHPDAIVLKAVSEALTFLLKSKPVHFIAGKTYF